MASKLLEKAYNCYMMWITNVLYGRTNQDYNILYGATLMLKNKITDKALTECMENRLLCPVIYPMNNVIIPVKIMSWALSTELTHNINFDWHDTSADVDGIYTFTTLSVDGFNFLYLSIPEGKAVKIHNSLDIILYDSERPSSDDDQQFCITGKIVTSNGTINNVFRKNDIYNSHNPAFFKIRIY